MERPVFISMVISAACACCVVALILISHGKPASWAILLFLFFISVLFSFSLAKKIIESGRKYEVPKQYSIAKSYFQKGEYEKAIEEYQKEYDLDPSDITPLIAIAEIYRFYLKDLEKAIRTYEVILQKADDNTCAFCLDQIGNIYLEMNEKEKAKNAYEKLLEKYPNHPLSKKATRIISS